MLNSVVIEGRLTADPELKTTPSGVAVTSFSIANQRNFKNADNERETDFYNVVAWRGTAEHICKYFKKGSAISIEGHLQTRKYQDKDGNNRTAFEIVADTPHFGLGNGGSNSNNQNGDFTELPDETDFPDDLNFPPLN